MEKDNTQNLLLEVGRKIVREKGTDALTVRKLSEASGCSVGAIYNQFANMDNFIVIQNYITLDKLAESLDKVPTSDDAYEDLNNFLQVFVDFVLNNKNLWFMLYSFHLRQSGRHYSFFYLRKVAAILRIVSRLTERIVAKMERPERVLSSQVLWLSLFAVSSLLTKDILSVFAKADGETICQVLANTYMAGLTVLESK